MNSTDSIIQIKSLYKAFGNHIVLDGIDLDIKKSSSLVIIGGSGTGKSVLIKTIVGLVKADNGSILIDGQETVNLSMKDRFEQMKKLGFLFQGGALFDSLTIEDNVTFAVEKFQTLTKQQKSDLATEKLEAVGLGARVLKMFPSELSGGMQKRVSLARAICSNPQILFFDEPTTGLDPIMSNVINELIVKVRDQLGATTITITHDMASAQRIATDVAMIYKGKIIWQGKKDQLDASNNPYVEQFVKGSAEGPINF